MSNIGRHFDDFFSAQQRRIEHVLADRDPDPVSNATSAAADAPADFPGRKLPERETNGRGFLGLPAKRHRIPAGRKHLGKGGERGLQSYINESCIGFKCNITF